MLEERQPSKGVRRTDNNTVWHAFFATRETEIKDDWGGKTLEVSDAKIQRSGSNPPKGMIPAGWLPNHQVAKEWLFFVKRAEHPVTSMP
jgi:hypothetical protein